MRILERPWNVRFVSEDAFEFGIVEQALRLVGIHDQVLLDFVEGDHGGRNDGLGFFELLEERRQEPTVLLKSGRGWGRDAQLLAALHCLVVSEAPVCRVG